jgi:GAG-pre-integrase domain
LLQVYRDETISLTKTKAVLSGTTAPQHAAIEAYIDPKNNLPTTVMYDYEAHYKVAEQYVALHSTVAAENFNLSDPQKELLRWHHRLGHIDFRKIKLLFRSGVLSRGDVNRHLHTSAAKLTENPKCASCLFGKQCQRSAPATTATRVTDSHGAIGRKATHVYFKRKDRRVQHV